MAKGIIREGGTVSQAPIVAPPPRGGGIGSPAPSPAPTPQPAPPATPPGPGGQAAVTVQQAINFTGMKVGYFKCDLDNTVANMYGESMEKWYYPPMEIKCLIERTALSYVDAEYGSDPTQSITISIPKLTVEQFNFTPEVGDIVVDRDRYYEVTSTDAQFYTAAGTPISAQSANATGNLIIYILNCSLTRMTRLNILES
jgi:hypothetical protein